MTEPSHSVLVDLLQQLHDDPVPDAIATAYGRYVAELEAHLALAGPSMPFVLRRPADTIEGIACESFCEVVRQAMPRLIVKLADIAEAVAERPGTS